MVDKGERWGSKRRFGIGPVPWIRQYFDQADAMLTSLHAINKGARQLVSDKALTRSPRAALHGDRKLRDAQQVPLLRTVLADARVRLNTDSSAFPNE